MAVDTTKLEVGPAIVELGEDADKITFESTIGGITLTTETTYREQKVDQTGETVLSKRITGRNVTLTIPFAEYDLDKIPKIMVGAKLVEDTVGGKKKVEVSTAVGQDLLTNAKKVVIKPLAALTDPAYWITLPKAFPETDLSYGYDNENNRITNITLRSTPDTNNVVLILGDETVTVA